MDRINIYEYDRKNRKSIVEAIEKRQSQIISWSYFLNYKSDDDGSRKNLSKASELFIDISFIFYNEDRTETLILPAELTITTIQNSGLNTVFIIIERQHSKQIHELLYYKVKKILSLEKLLGIQTELNNNIVDINQTYFDEVLENLKTNLFGNNRFKTRLKEELTKFRLFNRIGQQPIFSLLICGASGIGKTEVARILHKMLSPNEPMIKINFGNYSTQDALNSLIGSPRGYIGSNKGELPDKLIHSRSRVILIDEFEKATMPVHNFFLQLLEDGKFTDSLGREYNLDKYIIVFTSNMPKERISAFLPKELRSRFSYKCAFFPLSKDEKDEYVRYKGEQYLRRIKEHCCTIDEGLSACDLVNIDVSQYCNMRDINNEIMRQLTYALYDQIVIE